MKNNRLMVRFDDNTFMKLKEISRATGSNYSVVIRSLVKRQLDEPTDNQGNLKIDGTKKARMGTVPGSIRETESAV